MTANCAAQGIDVRRADARRWIERPSVAEIAGALPVCRYDNDEEPLC